jgi:hypothetical protein
VVIKISVTNGKTKDNKNQYKCSSENSWQPCELEKVHSKFRKGNLLTGMEQAIFFDDVSCACYFVPMETIASNHIVFN